MGRSSRVRSPAGLVAPVTDRDAGSRPQHGSMNRLIDRLNVDDTISWAQWLPIAGMVFRVASAPSSVAGLLGEIWPPSGAVLAVLSVLLVCVALNGFLVARTVLGQHLTLHRSRTFFVGDVLLAVALNVAAAAVLPRATQDDVFRDVAWFYLIGGVGIWTAVRGARVGLTLLALGIPLQLLMAVVNGNPLAELSLSRLLVRQIWLSLAVVMALALLPLYRYGRQLARSEGLRAGREAERAQQMRALHDTVLQTLEAIALRAAIDGEPPQERLAAVRHAAREQAAEIRALLLHDDSGEPSHDLRPTLLAQAVLARNAGVRTEVDLTELDVGDDARLPPLQVAALGAATGAALSNVVKHSRASSVTLHAGVHDGRVEVTVADAGRGFVPDRRAGFGVRESIHARMNDAGGGAEVRSVPGEGTAVTVWVPFRG